jgi:hypothetical protein
MDVVRETVAMIALKRPGKREEENIVQRATIEALSLQPCHFLDSQMADRRSPSVGLALNKSEGI